MSKSPRVIHTPGAEPVAAEAADTGTTDHAEAVQVPAGAELVATPEGDKGPQPDAESAEAKNARLRLELENAQLETLLAEQRANQAKLQAEIDAAAEAKAKRDAEQAAADRAAMSERLTSNRPAAGLQPEDVNPNTIRRAVLTEKGWVCPAQSPAAPAGVR